MLTVAGHDVGMSKRLLPLIPAGLDVDDVRPDAERLTILAHPRAVAAACPTCGRSSARLHSRYTRIPQESGCDPSRYVWPMRLLGEFVSFRGPDDVTRTVSLKPKPRAEA